jgi:hypothetical protein
MLIERIDDVAPHDHPLQPSAGGGFEMISSGICVRRG